ncbi:cupin domain-containing protein [Methylomonas sp. LL1]|uniref:cupin domain-containing protein n=1 Tax=Methylomonas sp. LL1 TaxID=2785785 RepID=UPI0018C38DA2|nr:hypothetical protein [Methylomonas sp. LL1]QPK65204.1 cupin domain-containing protein [Methylomonas sp. LL1]
MQILHTDSIFQVPPGTSPDYNRGNSLLKLMGLMERTQLAAEREFYLTEHLQYLFPYDFLELYGPAGSDGNITAPEQQDNKEDFQKQNIRDFRATDTSLLRGWVAVGDTVIPFVRISYRSGPDSLLSQAANHNLGANIKLYLRVGNLQTSQYIVVPYNEVSDSYAVELWGFSGPNLRNLLDAKGRDAFDRGELIARGDLIKGTLADFNRNGLDNRNMFDVSPDNSMHPIKPLHLELAWTSNDESAWDSKSGANYQYEFSMILRGWDNFLGVGISPNPHGGVGFLEFRNLLSNYFAYSNSRELERKLEPWNFDAHGRKDHNNITEKFMAVDYMDLHIMKPNCGIGLHRHRDNQEIFLMMEGSGFMVVGDWAKPDNRERCFEIRTLRAGHFAMLKGGNLHGLMNPSDEDLSLFMFGGYD